MFYVQNSQHFNQSDFGILFPYLTRRFTKAEEPERVLELNTRAMVQLMRESGIEVAGEDDFEILDGDSDIRSWVPIPDENSQDIVTGRDTLDAVTEKLSISPMSSNAAPADVSAIGQNLET